MSVQFLGPHLYRSVIILSVWVRVRGHTYIDWPSPCHVSLVSRTAPILIGHLLVTLCRDRTYIDRSLSCQLEFGAAPISIDHFLIMSVQFLGLHLYRSVIILLVSVWVWVRAAPISIDHLLVMSVQFLGPYLYRSVIIVSVWVEAAPISIDHYRVSLSRGRTYIDRPSPCHVISVSRTTPISIGHHLVSLSLSLRVEAAPILIGHLFVMSVQFLGPHLYRSVIIV